jgi:5'-3' exonuclease
MNVVQYFLILSRALFGEVEVRKVSIRDVEGVVGAVAMRAKCGSRRWRRWRNSEDGFESMVKRERRLG